MNVRFSNWDDIWNGAKKQWNSQCKIVYKVVVIFFLNSIWFARNSVRFKETRIAPASSIAAIISACGVAGNNFRSPAYTNMLDFVILKNFRVTIQPPFAQIGEVIWKPPPWGWIKFNCDGASLGN